MNKQRYIVTVVWEDGESVDYLTLARNLHHATDKAVAHNADAASVTVEEDR